MTNIKLPSKIIPPANIEQTYCVTVTVGKVPDDHDDDISYLLTEIIYNALPEQIGQRIEVTDVSGTEPYFDEKGRLFHCHIHLDFNTKKLH